jgi:hypothetical protein
MSLSLLVRGVARGLLSLSLLPAMPICAQNAVPVEEENRKIQPRPIPAFSAWQASLISARDGLNSGCCDPGPSPPNPDYAAKPPLSFSAGDKASFYRHRVLDFGSAFGPAVEAAAVMASPPKAYPDDWRQGAEGFGRNYGAVLGRVQVAEFSRFAAGVALREDPRYYPSPNRNAASRILHAVGFTLADHSDSGQVRPAFANLIGATAGGFVGDAYLPSNYTDLRHSAVRIGIQMTGFAVRNLVDEFAPEFDKITHALKTRLHAGN